MVPIIVFLVCVLLLSCKQQYMRWRLAMRRRNTLQRWARLTRMQKRLHHKKREGTFTKNQDSNEK